MKNWKSIELPSKMHSLPLDKSGIPIPFTILIDEKGLPNFSQHDVTKLHECIDTGLCSICGQTLGTDIWLIGGAIVASNPRGGYVDPPVHKQCGNYALQVCPYLAMPSFAKRSPNELEQSNSVKVHSKPNIWVFVKTSSFELIGVNNSVIIFLPERPFLDMNTGGKENFCPKVKQNISCNREG